MYVTDDRTGEPVELGEDARTPLRVAVRGTDGPTALRALVVGDVLARVVELQGRQVVRLLPGSPQAGGLGVHPPTKGADGSAAHVHVGGTDHAAGDGVLVEVAAVAGEARLPEGVDPLALRLVLLRHARREPFTLTAAQLADAEVQLGRWRRKVAEWANAPSQAIPAELRRRHDEALSGDLDVPAVLSLLDGVETGYEVPNGARFELFAYADRALGLELVREVGQW